MQDEINTIVSYLQEGKTILYPTDTIWGLGCDPANDAAVLKLYNIKKREDYKAMIVLIGEIGQLYQYVENIPEIAWDIVEFAEKPLTVIYPKGKNVSKHLIGADGSIAIRLTKDPFCTKIIQKFRKGIVSTSANISGFPSPSNFKEIDAAIVNSVDYAVDHKRTDSSHLPPSTIIKLELNGEIKFIRK